jgi:iron complex outermembrane recepter protein
VNRSISLGAGLAGVCLMSFGSAIAAPAGIEEIVVTAQKREQSLQEVPISVTVLSGQVVDDFGMFRFEDLATMIPNLHIDESLGSPVIHVRGLGSGAENFAFEQSVGLFVDGVYSGRSHLFENPLFDVAQIEVVRGPQGALFGKNTNAGAISVTTRRPTDTLEASVRGGYEFDYNGNFMEGIVSGPLAEGVLGRLAVRSQKQGGYLKNRASGKDEPEKKSFMARGTLVFDPFDNLEVIAKLEYSESETKGGWFQIANFGTGPLTDLWRATDPFAEDRLDQNISSDTGLDPQGNDSDTLNAALTLNWSLGEYTLSSITGFGRFDYTKVVEFTGTALGLGQSTIPEDFEQWSQEFRLLSPVGRTFEYVLGLAYMEHDMKLGQLTEIAQFGPFSGLTSRLADQDGKSWSVYGSGTWHIADDWRATASLRHSRERKSGRTVHTVTGFLPPTWMPYDLSGKRKENHTNGSLNLQWDVTGNVMTYLSYATGAKVGGFLSNDSSLLFRILQGVNDFEYEDERAKSWELGMKATLLDNRALLNIAVFRTEFEDLQTSSFQGFFFVIGNAAEALVKGFEADASLLVSDNLSINLALAYLDAEYKDYPGGPCLFGATAADGCDIATGTQNLAGTRLVRSPEWEGSLTMDWKQPLTERLTFGAQVNITYKDDFYHQPNLDPGHRVDAHYKINARLGIGPADRQWEVALVGRNLTDKITKNWSFNTPFFGDGSRTASIAPPRMITLEAGYRF